MKNNIIYIFLTIIIFFFKITFVYSTEQFNFDVTEVEITNDGNLFKGLKRGTATTDEGLVIIADEFEYDKILNILTATGNVSLLDSINDYKINAEKIVYLRTEEKIFSNGKTEAIIEGKYNFNSNDVIFLRNEMKLISSNKSVVVDDKFTKYFLDQFDYSLKEKQLKGKNINVITNFNKEVYEQDNYQFKDGIFNLENNNFLASDTKIFVKKNVFDVKKNDPRIYGVSSSRTDDITIIKNGIFTSCAKNQDRCPPWSIKARKITHDKVKKQISYDHSVLKIYDVPIIYFPKFFHPDPSVERQSGFLQPRLNDSNVLGTSFITPYFHVISDNRDITFRPTIFDSNIYMLQNEYRQENKNSSLMADLGLTKGYKSSSQGNKRNSIGHFFTKFDLDLKLDNFIKSDMNLSFEKVTNDTYLKIFDTNLVDIDKNLKPSNPNSLVSNLKFDFQHEDFNLDTGMIAYENLNGSNNDRFQYVLPYYNFSYIDLYKNDFGNFNFSSNGSNNLNETNNLKTYINNNFNFLSKDLITDNGFKNNYGIYFKNTNNVGKNNSKYKSSPQVELMNIVNLETSYPLIKLDEKYTDTLTPKLSFRINPGDMKDYSNSDRQINTNNVFSINRLGLGDSYEGGKSFTLGIDYLKENINNLNKYFELNLATVLRDAKQDKIPSNSSIAQKTSNLFGSSSFGFSKNLKLEYDFAVDNDLQTFEHNSINAELSFSKFTTNFKFTEHNGKMGDTNVLENSTSLSIREDNFLTFKTRRNRKINLTEYYDLVYEYKNDCLTAGIKYKKTYYQDRDVKPKEDLFLTITLFPLTQYEQKVDQNLYRD